MRYEEAIKSYERAISVAPDRPEIVSVAAFSLGRLYLEQGHVHRARQAFVQAIDTGERAIGSLAAVELGRSAVAEGHLEAALKVSDYVRQVGHPNIAPAAQVLRGDVLAKQGNVTGAIDAFRSAIRSGNPVYAPSALNGYGELVMGQQPITAGLAFRQVKTVFDEPSQTVRAERNLDALYRTRSGISGELDGIESRWVIDTTNVVSRNWDTMAAGPAPRVAEGGPRIVKRPDDPAGGIGI